MNKEAGGKTKMDLSRSEHFKPRIIEKGSEEDKRLEQDEGIELVFSDPQLRFPVPITIRGFSKTMDAAGNDVLYWKLKDKDRVILIHQSKSS